MKKIQKLLSAFLFISASLSAAVPTQYNLDLNKNNGVEITNFIKKYITPQRPNPKNFGMLQLNFDRDDIQIGSQLKQAIESKKVVVAVSFAGERLIVREAVATNFLNGSS